MASALSAALNQVRLSPRRWAVCMTVVSFVGWSSWELLRPPVNPLMDWSRKYTDHFSHMNAARLFLRFGDEIWRKPLIELLPRPTAQQYALLPGDAKVCRDCPFIAPGWEKPVLQSWPQVVRFYPPGDLLLTAPVAALYHFTALSMTWANRLLLIVLLAAAHVGLFFLLDGLLARPEMRAVALLPAFLGVNVVLHWTLEGFYDAAIIAPLLLSWRFLQQRRGLAAVVAFSVAAFLHFRAIYYVPWVIAAVAPLVRERQWRGWERRHWVAATVALCLCVTSLYTFSLVLPGLLKFRSSPSPLLIFGEPQVNLGVLALGAMAGTLAVAAFVRARSWIDVAMVGWLALLLTIVRQSYAWYPVAVVPWLVSPPHLNARGQLSMLMDARVLVFLFLALLVHPDWPFLADNVLPSWVLRLAQ
jgi:hypothetical protein